MRGESNLQASLAWIGRLLRLDFTAFDEIRGDVHATTSSLLVVYGASLMAGIGSWLWAVTELKIDETEILIQSTIIGSFAQTAVFLVWVYITHRVAARAYASATPFLELARTMGFAFAPVGLSLLVAIGPLAVPFGLLAFGMTLLLTTAAVQSATDLDPRDSIVANLAGFSVFVIMMGVLANISEVRNVGGIAPGILFFALDL